VDDSFTYEIENILIFEVFFLGTLLTANVLFFPNASVNEHWVARKKNISRRNAMLSESNSYPLLNNAAIMATFLSCLLVLLLCVAGREYACISLQDVGAGGRGEQILATKVFFSFYPCWTVQKSG
jgi:hypothetical protein